MSTSAAPVVTFKKGPSRRPQQSRKRTPPADNEDGSPSNQAEASTSSVVRPTKKSILNPLVQGTKRRREFGEEDENGGGLDDTDYKADESLIGGRGDQYATRSTEYDLETDGSVKVDGKKIRLNEDGEIDDGLYRGAANYLPTINKRTDVMDTKMKTGPIRATTNIRTITLVDYQPDVCKDYKETGFCGYGDSCKFLHDRGDYLAGWQLDKLGPEHGGVPADDDDDEEEVPFACLICRKEFTEPIVTKCGHYFCMRCALNRFIKSPKCYACGTATGGLFNKAEKILAKLEAKNKKKREEKGIVDEPEDDGGIEIGGADSDVEGGDSAPESD